MQHVQPQRAYLYSTPLYKARCKKVNAAVICAGLSEFPGFMQKDWFPRHNPGNLRGYLRTLFLRHIIDQTPENEMEKRRDGIAEAEQEIAAYLSAPNDRCRLSTPVFAYIC